jgi:Fe-S oxidoreductase
MCGRCATVCPENLNIGDMIREVRIQAFSEDLPLPGNIKYVKNQQKFVTSEKFFLTKPAPSGNTKRMFFPRLPFVRLLSGAGGCRMEMAQ